MAQIFNALFEWTLFSYRLVPPSGNIPLSFLWSLVNTGIRAVAFYGAIRLVMTAVSHGSFAI